MGEALNNVVHGLPCGIDTYVERNCRNKLGADSSWKFSVDNVPVSLPPGGTCEQRFTVYHTPTRTTLALDIKVGSVIEPRGKIYAFTDPMWEWNAFYISGAPKVRFDIEYPYSYSARLTICFDFYLVWCNNLN